MTTWFWICKECKENKGSIPKNDIDKYIGPDRIHTPI